MAFDGFLDDLGHVAHLLLHLAARVAQPYADHAHHQHDDRRHHQRQQGQFPVEPEHPAEQADDHQRILEHRGQYAGRCSGNLHDIKSQPGNQVARSLIVEITRRQRQQLAEHDAAQIHHQPVADPVQSELRDIFREPSQHKQPDDEHRRPADDRFVLVDEHAIEQWLQQRRQGRLRGGHNDDAEHADGERAPVRPHVAQ